MLKIATDLCQNLTQSKCAMPKLSKWALVAPAQSSIGLDVADIASCGVTAAVPINIKAYGSYFITGLEYRSDTGGLSSQMQGFGIGTGIGAGWSLPFVGAKGIGKIPTSIKKKVIESVGKSFQSKIENIARDLVWAGSSGGTRLLTGPDSNEELRTDDFHNSFVTIIGFGANFTINGISFGMILISKKQPIISASDFIYTRAIGLIGGVGLATSLDIEASGMVYRVGFM